MSAVQEPHDQYYDEATAADEDDTEHDEVVEQRRLKPHEGHEVVQSSITIPNVGGGLRDAQTVEPIEIHKGDEILILVRAKYVNHTFDPIADTEMYERRHKLAAEATAFILDPEDIEWGNALLDVFDERIAEKVARVKAAEQAKADADAKQGTLEDPEHGGAATAAENAARAGVDIEHDDDDGDGEDPWRGQSEEELDAGRDRLRDAGIG